MNTPARTRPERQQSAAHARRVFWVLVAIAVLAMGALSSALARQPGAWTGLSVAASGVVLLLASTLAFRVMVALEQRRRSAAVNAPARRSRRGASTVTKLVSNNRRPKGQGGAGGERTDVTDGAGGRLRESSTAGRG